MKVRRSSKEKSALWSERSRKCTQTWTHHPQTQNSDSPHSLASYLWPRPGWRPTAEPWHPLLPSAAGPDGWSRQWTAVWTPPASGASAARSSSSAGTSSSGTGPYPTSRRSCSRPPWTGWSCWPPCSHSRPTLCWELHLSSPWQHNGVNHIRNEIRMEIKFVTAQNLQENTIADGFGTYD